jgi:hypothetical protein
MASPAGASTFIFPGSALRRRSSLDVPMDDTSSEPPPPPPRVENPLLHNLRTPLASTQNNMTSPPLLPFSPFSPPPSLRVPSKYSSAASHADVSDAENWSLGLRQRKPGTTQGASSAWAKSHSEEPQPDHMPPPKTSYSLGTNYYVPVSEPTPVLTTSGAPTTEIESPSDNGRSTRSYVGTKHTYSTEAAPNTFTIHTHPILPVTATTDLFIPRDVPEALPEGRVAMTGHPVPVPHDTWTEDDILNYPERFPLAITSREYSCWEQMLRCLFGMDDDDHERHSTLDHGGITSSPCVGIESILR